MKISAHIEFDTFGEAEKVFRHLGMLEPLGAKSPDAKPAHAQHHAAPPTGVIAKDDSELPVTVSPVPQVAPAETVTLDDLKKSFQAYVGRGGGRTAATAMAILQAHGVKSIKDVQPAQFAIVKRAFDTAGPDMPLGEAA